MFEVFRENAIENNDSQNYLYLSGDTASIEAYKIHMGNIDQYFEAMGSEEITEKEIHRIPSFLGKHYTFKIVVQFYNPCGGPCREFAPHYKSLARSLQGNEVIQGENVIEFHAISCAIHNWLCQHENMGIYLWSKLTKPPGPIL
jgi:thiol-disulfide isomerase/thioredoxin